MNRLDEAVRKGVMLGLTAKECAYDSGYPSGTLTKRAKRLGLAFKWSRVAKIPTHLPMPPETVARRHEETLRRTMRGIEQSLLLSTLPPSHPSILALLKVVSDIRRRVALRS